MAITYTFDEQFMMTKGRTQAQALTDQGHVCRVGHTIFPQAISPSHALKLYASNFLWEGQPVEQLTLICGIWWQTKEQPDTDAIAKELGLTPATVILSVQRQDENGQWYSVSDFNSSVSTHLIVKTLTDYREMNHPDAQFRIVKTTVEIVSEEKL